MIFFASFLTLLHLCFQKIYISLNNIHIPLKKRDHIVKIIIFTFFVFLTSLTLIGTEKESQAVSRHHHGRMSMDKNHSNSRHLHKPHMHKREGKRSEMMFEHLNKEQQALYTRIHDLQKNIRKNMYALGQERRNIKNLKTSEDRKKSQENINKICNEIKQQIEEHQPRIVEAIGDLK